MFIVLEIQKDNGNLSILPFAFSDFKKARGKYYSTLAIASESSLERHGAVLLTEGGSVIANESFFNEAEEEVEENE